MQRRLCEMSEAKWSITEAKCLQISHNKYASQRDAISHSMGNLMLSHSAGMHNTDKSIAGISKRFHFASLHYIFSAYLPTHIKFLTEFHRIFFGTTCISFSEFNFFVADYLVFVDYCYNFVADITIFLSRMKNLYTSLQACCCCSESRDWLGTMVFLRDVI